MSRVCARMCSFFSLQLKSTLAFFCESCRPRLYYLSVSIIRFYFIWFDDYFSSIELVCVCVLPLLIAMWPLSPQAKYQMKLAYTHTHLHTSMGAKHFYWVQRSTMQKNKWEIGQSKMRSLFIRILYARDCEWKEKKFHSGHWVNKVKYLFSLSLSLALITRSLDTLISSSFSYSFFCYWIKCGHIRHEDVKIKNGKEIKEE